MSKFFSTMMTEAPFSRAAIAATQTARAAADDDDVRLAIPGDGVGRLRRLRGHGADSHRTGSSA